MLFVLHGGEPLPVITGAPRCCRQETFYGYKYEACHCCNYSELSATTLHCLLPGVALFCFWVVVFLRCIVSDNRVWQGRALMCGEAEQSIRCFEKVKRSQLELCWVVWKGRAGQGTARRTCLCNTTHTGGNSKCFVRVDLISQYSFFSVYTVRRIWISDQFSLLPPSDREGFQHKGQSKFPSEHLSCWNSGFTNFNCMKADLLPKFVFFLMSQKAYLIFYFEEEKNTPPEWINLFFKALRLKVALHSQPLEIYGIHSPLYSFWNHYWLHYWAPSLAMWNSRHHVNLPSSPSSCPLYSPQTWTHSRKHLGFKSISIPEFPFMSTTLGRKCFRVWPTHWLHSLGGNF